MCYTKCHNVNNYPPEKLVMLMNNIKLIISGHDTFRPLGIYCSSGPSHIVYVTQNDVDTLPCRPTLWNLF